MEQSEIYFRQLDRLVARDNFLEKEMLDSDVHHLEVRTGFFDKLAVLSAGSLAVGISFMTAEYQRGSIQNVNQKQYLSLLIVALIYILVSLILCVIHNFLISRAVFLLSEQLVYVYKGAHELMAWCRGNPNEPLFKSNPVSGLIDSYDKEAEKCRLQKERVIDKTRKTGIWAVVFLIIGYCVGLGAVVSIVANMK